MNVNYLKTDTIPRFQDGWQPILDTLRNGQFFVTTGEVLIPDFTSESSWEVSNLDSCLTLIGVPEKRSENN